MMYELIIIGGGPAGVAAGVYAARKKIKTLLVAEEWGGQSLVSADVQNWIGTKSVSGVDLAQMFEAHVKAQSDIDFAEGSKVARVEGRSGGGFLVTTESGKSFETRYLLVCSGGRRRKLGIPGEAEFEGRGVAYCSICDAPLFSGKAVAVVGGGNAGLEAVIDLLPYATKIYLLEFSDALKGDPVTQGRIKKEEKVIMITQAQTKEVVGDKFVQRLIYVDRVSNQEKKLDVGGVFVEIGILPNTEFIKELVETNTYGEIVVDHKTQRSSHADIWAAGDASDVLYKQNNVSAGDAVKAVLNIYDQINKDRATGA